jgi:tRNA 2-thiouridine synthesizing protein C
MREHILIHITCPPTPDCEALEYALAMAAFDLPVHVLLSGDGIYWLQAPQEARKPGGRRPDKLLGALGIYGIDEVACVATSDSTIKALNDTRILSDTELQRWAANAKQTVMF